MSTPRCRSAGRGALGALTTLVSLVGPTMLGACEEAALAQPAPLSTVTGARPLVAWRALSGEGPYRVEIESRVPEGRVLVSLDTLVDTTRFRPPRPLTDHRATVKVRITRGCPVDDGSALRERPASFQIDTRPLCPAPARLALSADRRQLEWTAVPRALRYDVSLLDLDGVRLAQAETRAPVFALPPRSDPIVAVVRPYCATGFGPLTSALAAP